MTPWIAGLLLLLAALDPVGSALVARTQPVIRTAVPLPVNGWALGESDVRARTIWLNPISIGIMGGEDREALAACTIVHEAAHLRYPRAEHEVAFWAGYVCLDRLGASRELRDVVYGQMMEAITPNPESDD